MVWLNLLIGILGVAGGLLDYLRQRELINGAQAELAKKNLEAALDITQKARAARKIAGDKFDAANGVPDDSDPNLRD